MEVCTTLTQTSGPLTTAALCGLKGTFEAKHHYPSRDMWGALAAILTTLEKAADGTAEPLIHLAALDPGVGKTQAVIHFLRALLASPKHSRTSVIVCVGRRSQINDMLREAQLPEHEYAVFTSHGDDLGRALSNRGRGEHDMHNARILFTTHSMVESRCGGGTFQQASEFHYRGQPREVRIWDEAILPGREVTLSRDDISSILKPIRRCRAELADELDALNICLRSVGNGAQFTMPDLASTFGVDLNEAL